MDSTVLLRSLHALGVPIVAAHVDYGLRDASGDDAAFVRAMAEELGVPAEIREIALGEGNRQQAAREARYAFFREVAERHGAPAVAVGHTASDQAETVLLNLVRGAGLAGLAGMAESRPLAPEAPDVRLVRPLLAFMRADVEAEARARGWVWREDASNASGAYRRNRIRQRVMPLLEEEGGPGTALRIAGAAHAARQAASDAEARLARVGEPDARGGAVPLAALRVLSEPERRALLAEMLRAWAPEAPRSDAIVASLDGLLESQVGARIEIGAVDVWRDRQRLVVAHARPPWLGSRVRLGEATETLYGTLTATPLAEVPVDLYDEGRNRVVVDARALDRSLAPWADRGPSLSPFPPPPPPPPRPLVLRPWRNGDRLRPLGMEGTELVSDILTDDRVPPSERRQRLVLASGDRIVWVVGHRLAHEARITPETQRAIALEWRPGG